MFWLQKLGFELVRNGSYLPECGIGTEALQSVRRITPVTLKCSSYMIPSYSPCKLTFFILDIFHIFRSFALFNYPSFCSWASFFSLYFWFPCPTILKMVVFLSCCRLPSFSTSSKIKLYKSILFYRFESTKNCRQWPITWYRAKLNFILLAKLMLIICGLFL